MLYIQKKKKLVKVLENGVVVHVYTVKIVY